MPETKLKYQSMIGTVREILGTARTYYVRTDGNDNNTGLTNDAAGAFRTVQRAVDIVATLDINGQTVTIQAANGTYGPVTLKNVPGYGFEGNLVLRGDPTAPWNVVIDGNPSTAALSVQGISSVWQVTGFRFTGAHGVVANNATVKLARVDFYNATWYQMLAMTKGLIYFYDTYWISGTGASNPVHFSALDGGMIYCAGITCTIQANLVYSCFASCGRASAMFLHTSAFNKGVFSVTGYRYGVAENSVIFTNGGGATYLPGSINGTVTSGGSYT